jgi:transaldolase
MADGTDEIVAAAEEVARLLDYDNLVIKIPCRWGELAAPASLAKRGYAIKCTACMTFPQAVLAAVAGARYVSMFFGQSSDYGVDFHAHARLAVDHFGHMPDGPQLIVGSIRKPYHVHEMLAMGVHIVTVPYHFLQLQQLSAHPKTTEAVEQFAAHYSPMREDGCRRARRRLLR